MHHRRQILPLLLLIAAILPPIALRGSAGPEPRVRTLSTVLSGPAPAEAAALRPGAPVPAWLVRVNRYRKLAGLPAITENPSWSAGDRLHARYMVKNDFIGHDEDPANQWYTKAGRDAARNGNAMVSSSTSASNNYAIDLWIQGPFHGVGILDPELKTTGFGSYRAADGGFQMAATLDVLRGLGSVPASVKFPVKFPSGPKTMPIRSYAGGEYPDPLSSCSGYTTPAGTPIVLQLGDGSLTPNVTAHRITLDGKPVEHCAFDETNYKNTDSSAESLGRAVLGARDAVVLMPKAPLAQGKTYRVSVTANGKTTAWTFKVATNAP